MSDHAIDDEKIFGSIIADSVRRYNDLVICGQDIPPWIQKQIHAIRSMSDNLQQGRMLFIQGLQDEVDYLESLI
jgi:hypothetical protein